MPTCQAYARMAGFVRYRSTRGKSGLGNFTESLRFCDEARGGANKGRRWGYHYFAASDLFPALNPCIWWKIGPIPILFLYLIEGIIRLHFKLSISEPAADKQ